MPSQPDLHFDIDALFAHLIENCEHDPADELEWQFTLRHKDFDTLEHIAESLSSEFDIHLQEEVETIDENGSTMGPPLLAVVIQAPLPLDEVKQLHERFAELAESRGLTYEGVTCGDPFDGDEAFGWLDLESAAWRLRYFTDSGLEPGEPVPFVFAIEAETKTAVNAACAAFEADGFADQEFVEDEEGVGVIIRVDGKNDEALLNETYRRVEALAMGVGAELVGVQFFEESEDESPEDDDEADDQD